MEHLTAMDVLVDMASAYMVGCQILPNSEAVGQWWRYLCSGRAGPRDCAIPGLVPELSSSILLFCDHLYDYLFKSLF